MSPVVQRQRPSTNAGKKNDDQHWGMLIFESLSAGATSLLVTILIILALIGVFNLVVWPLTFWDGAESGLEQYASWGKLALGSIFIGGSLAGFWCFSGAAFKGKPKAKAPVVARRRA